MKRMVDTTVIRTPDANPQLNDETRIAKKKKKKKMLLVPLLKAINARNHATSVQVVQKRNERISFFCKTDIK